MLASEFEKRFLVPGAHAVEGVSVSTATPTDDIVNNIKINIKKDVKAIHHLEEWREGVPFALVGGGPSLKTQLEELKKYKYIMACGSVHDYLCEQGFSPDWTVICDPDPVMETYLTRRPHNTKYLVASQCSPSMFEHLKGEDVTIWHLAGDKFDQSIYGENNVTLGGGCTVGTRAMAIAMGFGFYNLHLFGFDTCLDGENHHAYKFNNPELEKIYDTHEIFFEQDGPKFQVAGYHLGQLFDIKTMMGQFAGRMSITVHGESLLSYFMDLAVKRLALYKEELQK